MTILLVEDNVSYTRKIARHLNGAGPGRFKLVHVTRLADAIKHLSEAAFDVVLLDLVLPDSPGLETLTKVHAAAPQVPIIVLTERSEEPMVAEALQEGVQDYLVKNKTISALLTHSIRYSIERHRAIIEHKDLEARFLQSQKLEAVGRLAGGVAHDFNNLLTAILGYCKILEISMAPDDARISDLQEIVDASNRAASLTQQLLAFSRRQVLTPKVLNLNVIVTRMGKMLRCLIGEDLSLSVVLDQELTNVKADAGQIEQVIMNLVVNARDAMPKGGKISIETKNIAFSEDSPGRHDMIPAGAYSMIAVSDSGCGMDSETLAHIFEPFFTTKEQGQGTGLGLSTVYGIVKQSGGYIWVYSEVGQGSAFKIYLPISAELVQTAVCDRIPIKTLRGTETILLAEDDALLRNMLCRILGQNGYMVLAACNGKEAIGILASEVSRIDLILTDIVMPEVGGRGLADHANAICPQINVIFMSGYTDDVIIRRGTLEPGMLFIQKPISSDALLEKIRGVLDAPSTRRRPVRDSASRKGSAAGRE